MHKLNSVVILALCAHMTCFSIDAGNLTRGALALLGVATVVTVTEYCQERPIVVNLAKRSGTHVKDLSAIAAISLTAAGVSAAFPGHDVGVYAGQVARHTIPIAACGYLVQNGIVRKILGQRMMFGGYLKCENKECMGSCDECKLRTFVMASGLYLALDRAWAAYNN